MFKRIISKFKLIFIPCPENNYRPKFLESDFLFYLVIGLLALKIVVLFFFIYFPQSALFADITKNALMELTNQERESLGIQPLNENIILNQAAYLKAKDMLEKDYFSHQSPEGISPWYWFKKTGYNYQVAGENLAIGFLDSEEVHQAWLNSLSHKNNLLNPNYKEIGIAVLRGDFTGNDTTVVVQLLGTPQALVSWSEDEPKTLTETEAPKKEEVSQESMILSEELPEELSSLAEASEDKKEKNIKDNFVFNFFQFVYSDYNNLIQEISYAVLILIIISLMISIFFRPDKDLILRTVVFVVLLSFSIFFNKEIIIQLIPHSLIIY